MDSLQKHESKRTSFMNNILDAEFHLRSPVCSIIPTNTKKKENIFNTLRPYADTVLDYNISQTDTKLDAGNTKIHVQETIAEYIPKETAPKPKRIRVKTTKYFSGGPPHWIFVDELWLRQREKSMKEGRAKARKLIKAQLKAAKRLTRSVHQRVVNLAGPEWYQELSPNQLATVENLKNCILKDLAEDTILNTQENIGYLGLLLRPNHRHIEKALKNCCKCPVEFLLILYQLINPNRTKYSINDRLLLSAVVHLTMMKTLRELHVRIPSPPKPPVVTKKATVKKKKIKYESPYLVPFTFLKKPPKLSGIYTNKHIQRPQNPYFCYLEELKKTILEASQQTKKDNIVGSSDLAGEQGNECETENILDEIEVELRTAQKMYEKLVDFRPVPKLLKPSRYILCNNFRHKLSESQTEEEKEDIIYDTPRCSCGIEIDPLKRSVSCECSPELCYFVDEDSESCICASKSSKCGCASEIEKLEDSTQCTPKNTKNSLGCASNTQDARGSHQQAPKSACGCAPKSEKPYNKCYFEDQPSQNSREDSCGCNVQSHKQNKSRKNSESNVCGKTKSCTCDSTGEKHFGNRPLGSDTERNFSCGSSHVTASNTYQLTKLRTTGQDLESTRSQCGTVRVPDDVGYPICDKYNQKKEEPCKHDKALELYEKWYHLIRPSRELKEPCSCKQKYRQFIDTSLCQCKRCCEERKMKNITYVISGMKETESHDVIPVIERVVEGKLCKCLKKYENRINEYELDKEVENRIICKCHKAVEEMLKTPLCQCPKCKEDRKSRASKFIIKSIKKTDSENLRIIEGISTGKPCDCVKEYDKRTKRYETYKQGKDLMASMKAQEHKYVIGGVVSTPRGPQYVITGMRPPINCTCVQQARQEAKDKHMQEIMPQAPRGRVPYQIVGVKETPQGNVYILNNALSTPDCGCMKAFNTFQEQHSLCMNLYERYLAKMKEEYNEFMNEMLPPSASRRSSKASGADFLPVKTQEEEVFGEGETENENEETVNKKEQIQEDVYEGLENNNDIPSEDAAQKPQEDKSLTGEDKTLPCDPCRTTCGTIPAFCNCGNPYYSKCCKCSKIQKIECAQCTCGGQVIECVDCTCGEEEVEEEVIPLKRFFIFDKILCDRKWQSHVLKKALQSMADDGFPLAKLPHCYELPHFKLWMQMRCRTFWTQKDRYTYIHESRKLWRHCDTCGAWGYSLPKLDISPEKGHQLNWSHADYVRSLVGGCLKEFYREIKQNRINFGREFFPSTFSYEFPFKTWRDCFFAYTPTKEEDVRARFVWQKFDFKNFAEMKRFCGLS